MGTQLMDAGITRMRKRRRLGIPVRPPTDTHCGRGHERTPENTYIDPSGDRACRACRRFRHALKRERAS